MQGESVFSRVLTCELQPFRVLLDISKNLEKRRLDSFDLLQSLEMPGYML
uniref:Macaca fascicularis brain cDNA clone: QflA-20683, similar to human hypothetical protein FLJ35382 (FLJ35382), mRNA, RefSeq: NM_152608.2 n=1 Tax=Macaca fascicularis TaxID=9541 RepID=I7G6M6_MACFA|nr:unnamed protein product [Macaca fascicularis]